jgi:hypothetical protein
VKGLARGDGGLIGIEVPDASVEDIVGGGCSCVAVDVDAPDEVKASIGAEGVANSVCFDALDF